MRWGTTQARFRGVVDVKKSGSGNCLFRMRSSGYSARVIIIRLYKDWVFSLASIKKVAYLISDKAGSRLSTKSQQRSRPSKSQKTGFSLAFVVGNFSPKKGGA